MSRTCEALSGVEVVLMGGIPSLIYTSTANTSVEDPIVRRFDSVAEKIVVTNELNKFMLGHFLSTLVRGVPLVGECLFFLYEFAILSGSRKILFPLCYIRCILMWLLEYTYDDSCVRVGCAEPIRKIWHMSDINLISNTDRGKAWEFLIDVAILLRAMYCYLPGERFPLLNKVPADGIMCFDIPDDIATLETAKTFIEERLRSSREWLCVFHPKNSQFPLFDGFIGICKEDGTITISGYQDKSGNDYPSGPAPEWVNGGAYLIRGKAPKKAGTDKAGTWIYLSEEEVLDLLGTSLSLVYASAWPN
jgi:hypothetical protein